MDESDNIARDILLFLRKISEEYYLPPDQREFARKLYERAGASAAQYEVVAQVEVIEVVAGNKTWQIPKVTFEKMASLLGQGRVIDAIKELRSCTHCGLKEAKDLVEQCDHFKKHYRPGRW